MRSTVIAVLLFTLAVATSAHAERLAIAGTTGVDIIDTASGKSLASVAIAGGATQVLATPDGSRLIAVSRGPGAPNWYGQFKPTAKASVAVIDAASMTVVKQSEIGWDATDPQISADGKTAVILSPGAATKPFSSIHVVDLATGDIVAKQDFTRRAAGALLAGAGHVAVYFEGVPKNGLPTLLRFLALPSLEAADEISIAEKTRAPAAFENHDLIYLLEQSGFRPATLYAVSITGRKLVASHEVGQIASIGGFDPATSRLYVLSQSTTRGKRGFNGRVDIFRNGEPEHALKTTDIPTKMTFTPDRKQALIHSSTDTSVLDIATMHQDEKPVRYVAVPYSIAFTPDQKRAVLYMASSEACCSAILFDVENRKHIKHIGVGGAGIRIAEALLAVAATGASYANAYSAAKSTGASSFHYSVYTPSVARVGRGPMVMDAAGQYAYAVDSKTSRLTTIDIAAGDRIKKDVDIKNGALELVALNDGAILAVLGEKALTFVDASKREVIAEHQFPGELKSVEVTGGGERAIAISEGRVAVFDGAGKLVSENTSVAKPVGWLVLP